MIQNKIADAFRNLYQKEPFLVRSPGRVNLIGEHTDYNHGFVLPAAIDKAIYFAVAPSASKSCRLFAVDMDDGYDFQIDSFERTDKGWPNYLLGVIDQFQKAGYELNGFDCAFGGDIPIGAGLSSSAAIEAGLAFIFNELFDLNVEKLDLVKMAQKAENEFVGVRCGIMDQFVNIFGAENKVLKLDCRSLEFEHYPFEFDDIDVVLLDTQVSHSLASSEYNIRRRQCETGVQQIQKSHPEVNSLRDITIEMLQEHKLHLDPIIYKRCDYVIRENDRLLAGCADLQRGDLIAFGQKMYETHAGLRDDYEVSCPELDFLVDLTLDEEGVLGARMMGGGFGGCIINLVQQSALKEFTEKARLAYKSEMGRDLKIYITHIEAGTSIIQST